MATYTELTAAGVTTRAAAALTGLPRSTATRRRTAAPDAAVPAPTGGRRSNRLTAVERLQILAVLDQPTGSSTCHRSRSTPPAG